MTLAEFARFRNENQVRTSVGRTGVCWGTAAAESFLCLAEERDVCPLHLPQPNPRTLRCRGPLRRNPGVGPDVPSSTARRWDGMPIRHFARALIPTRAVANGSTDAPMRHNCHYINCLPLGAELTGLTKERNETVLDLDLNSWSQLRKVVRHRVCRHELRTSEQPWLAAAAYWTHIWAMSGPVTGCTSVLATLRLTKS
jgi:hypothetical protein